MTLKLPESLFVRFNSTAKRAKRSKSDLVRQYLENALENPETSIKGSCLELAADLCGIVEGPGNLSHNYTSHYAG